MLERPRSLMLTLSLSANLLLVAVLLMITLGGIGQRLDVYNLSRAFSIFIGEEPPMKERWTGGHIDLPVTSSDLSFIDNDEYRRLMPMWLADLPPGRYHFALAHEGKLFVVLDARGRVIASGRAAAEVQTETSKPPPVSVRGEQAVEERHNGTEG